MTVQRFAATAIALAALVSTGCQRQASDTQAPDSKTVTQFLADANENLLKLGNAANEAGWEDPRAEAVQRSDAGADC